MVTFIDDARDFRSRGASRQQLLGFLKMYGVDDERAALLADRLDSELGIFPLEPTLEAPGATRSAQAIEPVIDLRDRDYVPLVASPRPAIALSRVQELVDTGVPRREIQHYLQRSGVVASEAAYVSQTTPPSRRQATVDYASPVKRAKRRRDGSYTFAVLTLILGVALVIFGAFIFRGNSPLWWRENWVWMTATGLVITVIGIKSVINASL